MVPLPERLHPQHYRSISRWCSACLWWHRTAPIRACDEIHRPPYLDSHPRGDSMTVMKTRGAILFALLVCLLSTRSAAEELQDPRSQEAAQLYQRAEQANKDGLYLQAVPLAELALKL